MNSPFIVGKTPLDFKQVVPSPTQPQLKPEPRPKPAVPEEQTTSRRESTPNAKANVYRKEPVEEDKDTPDASEKGFNWEYVKFYFDFRKVGGNGRSSEWATC